MGQLAGLPRSAVGAQFGAVGERLQALARGHDPRPIVPRRRPERVEASATFEPALEGVGAVGLTLRRLAAELCDRLRERHLAPGRATLELVLEDAPDDPRGAALPAAGPRAGLDRPLAPVAPGGRRPARFGRLLPDSNQVGVRRRDRFPVPDVTVRNLDKSMSLSASHQSGAVEPPPKATTIGIWQEPPDEEEPPEPRVASVLLAFDRLSDPAARQLPAFEAQAGRWEELRWSLERIRHRFGSGRLWRASVERPMAALPEHRSRLVDIGS